MSFLDKVKAGVAVAGNKAKIVVEVNRLKLQNSSKQGEIDRQYKELGRLTFVSAQEGSWPPAKEQLEPYIERIVQLQAEIEQNLQQIASLSDEKQCRNCGNNVPIEDRFCSKCGQAFPSEEETARGYGQEEGLEDAASDDDQEAAQGLNQEEVREDQAAGPATSQENPEAGKAE